MSEVGTFQSETSLRSLAPRQALRIIWSGLHIERKALPILVHAIAQLNPGCNVEVHILGAGRGSHKETDKAKTLAEKLGMSSKLIWHGNLPRAEALQKIREGHVLVHTSLLEGTPWVVMEALASGMPVICHEACGMATVVTLDCGIKVPMTGVQDSICGFRDAIQNILDNPAWLKHLSEGAVQRSEALTWEKKILVFNRAYEEGKKLTVKSK
jgi:glycosyltransferase involved in cell wall biosynthesis